MLTCAAVCYQHLSSSNVKVHRIGVQNGVDSSTCCPVAVSLAIGRGITILFLLFIGIKNRRVRP
jgi:hypothetical protein